MNPAVVLYLCSHVFLLTSSLKMRQKGPNAEIVDVGKGRVYLDSDFVKTEVGICFMNRRTASTGSGILFCYKSSDDKVATNGECGPGFCSFEARISTEALYDVVIGDPSSRQGFHAGKSHTEGNCLTFEVFKDRVSYEPYNDNCPLDLGSSNSFKFDVKMKGGDYKKQMYSIVVKNAYFKKNYAGVVVSILFLILILLAVGLVALWWFKYKKPRMRANKDERSFVVNALNTVGLGPMDSAELKALEEKLQLEKTKTVEDKTKKEEKTEGKDSEKTAKKKKKDKKSKKKDADKDADQSSK